jgi:hypothetical protein
MDAYWQEIERRVQEDIRKLEAEQPIEPDGWRIMEMYLRSKLHPDSRQEKARRVTTDHGQRERKQKERAARWARRLSWVRIASLTIWCALIL